MKFKQTLKNISLGFLKFIKDISLFTIKFIGFAAIRIILTVFSIFFGIGSIIHLDKGNTGMCILFIVLAVASWGTKFFIAGGE